MEKQKVTVVFMAEEHVPAIAELERACFSQPWSEQGIYAELYDPTARFFVALEHGEVAGYAGMHGVCGEGYVANVAVFPDKRGKGVGQTLVRALIFCAREEGYDFLSLEVRPSNLPAIGLYHREGFRQVGVRKGFYDAPKEDAWIMTLLFERLS